MNELAEAGEVSASAVTLRPAGSSDQRLLYEIYASTREDELAFLDWTADQKTAFLQMQFAAQSRHYEKYYPDASYQVVLCDGEPAGRLIVGREPDGFLIIDVALLPPYRGRGIGGGLVKSVLREAAREGKPVRIHVERTNRAMRLYHRLGFVPIGENGIYLLMEWKDIKQGESHVK